VIGARRSTSGSFGVCTSPRIRKSAPSPVRGAPTEVARCGPCAILLNVSDLVDAGERTESCRSDVGLLSSKWEAFVAASAVGMTEHSGATWAAGSSSVRDASVGHVFNHVASECQPDSAKAHWPSVRFLGRRKVVVGSRLSVS
jgi:hypothetical protein